MLQKCYFLLILDKLFVTELLHAKLTKSCEKAYKIYVFSIYFVYFFVTFLLMKCVIFVSFRFFIASNEIFV